MNFTFLEIVAMIAALAAVAGAITVMSLARRWTRTASEVEYAAHRLTALTRTARGGAGLAVVRRMRGGNEPDAMNRSPGTFGLADR